MNLLTAVLIAVVQGATEFLPISSKAHDALVGRLLGVEEMPVAFLVTIHLGTLLAVFVYYRHDLWAMLRSLFPAACEESEAALSQRCQYRRLFWLLLLGTIPAAVLGALFESNIEAALNTPIYHGYGLLFTALILTVASRLQGTRGLKETGWRQALGVGLAQSMALLPGVSRSGSTITAGLLCGFEREFAPRFAFLLSIPVILGGFLFKVKDMVEAHVSGGLDPLTYPLSALVAGVTGYFAIVLVINSVKRGNLLYFAAYCLAVGLTVILVCR
ncbi:undecaprenyl-diphosphate phosphatase [bacterium]|nr:undecaprenyl-diphosphate phosphatase [bacterium]